MAEGLSLRQAADRIGVTHVFLGEVERGRKALPRERWATVAGAIPGVTEQQLDELTRASGAHGLQFTLREAGPQYESLGELLRRRAIRKDLKDSELSQLLQLLDGE